jgi:hypothetical protein
MISIWESRLSLIVMHDHDALTFMYPEEVEDEIIPILLANLVVPVALEGGRTLQIPYDVEVGWNKGHFDSRTNPDGLRAYSGHDPRKRQPVRGLLDSIVKKRIGGAR